MQANCFGKSRLIEKMQILALPTLLLVPRIFEHLDWVIDDLLLWGENDRYDNDRLCNILLCATAKNLDVKNK